MRRDKKLARKIATAQSSVAGKKRPPGRPTIKVQNFEPVLPQNEFSPTMDQYEQFKYEFLAVSWHDNRANMLRDLPQKLQAKFTQLLRLKLSKKLTLAVDTCLLHEMWFPVLDQISMQFFTELEQSTDTLCNEDLLIAFVCIGLAI